VAEEKTRVIRGKKSASSEPHRVGDKIVFYCPNGDRIVVKAEAGGKRGTCSKCGVQVVIPVIGAAAADDEQPPVFVTNQSAAADVEPATEETAAEPVAEGLPEAEPEATAASAFETPTAAPPAPGFPPANAAPPSVWPGAAPATEASGSSQVELDVGGLDPSEERSAPPLPPDDGAEHPNPVARLVARLWMERDHGGIIELHLVGGSVILPEWYEVNWSRGSHGLFASQAADGSVTLTAVAWEAIQKIVVRQVQGLPDGMFE
jgi:hypothetical protein